MQFWMKYIYQEMVELVSFFIEKFGKFGNLNEFNRLQILCIVCSEINVQYSKDIAYSKSFTRAVFRWDDIGLRLELRLSYAKQSHLVSA